jgi:NADPH:quinone reductase-like Zn-dependent oxidoreductase
VSLCFNHFFRSYEFRNLLILGALCSQGFLFAKNRIFNYNHHGSKEEKEMKAWVIHEFGGPEVMKLENIGKPEIKSHEVLIKTECTAVNPVDWKIREGMIEMLVPHEFPAILGWDVAGVIDQIGSDVKGLRVGDFVYAFCRRPVVKNGTFAEYVAFDAEHVAHSPSNLTMAQAASLPLVALTAWQSLFDFANVSEGDDVLIHAGAGGVGSIAIQLAKHAKARVITTASPKNFDYVRQLGANDVIDYHTEDFVEVTKKLCPKGVDMVFDCVGGKTFHSSIEVIKKGGSLVSICNMIDESFGAEKGVKSGFVFVAPNGEQLASIARLMEEGVIVPPNLLEFPFEEAREALEKNREGHTKGKIVLNLNLN